MNVPGTKPMMIIWQVKTINACFQAEHERVRQWLEENVVIAMKADPYSDTY